MQGASPELAGSTYERLKLLILNGDIPKGQPLIERSLAERLGVSRTPVRETNLRLEHEGLVEVVQGKGAFVVSYSIEDLVEIYDVRVGLEPVAARLRSEEHTSELQSLMRISYAVFCLK